MENEILQQILDRLGGLEGQMTDMRTDLGGLHTEMSDMRTSQAATELTLTRQMGAMMDTQDMVLEMARDSQQILHRVEAMLELYDSDKVALDVVISDHEKRIDALERQAV